MHAHMQTARPGQGASGKMIRYSQGPDSTRSAELWQLARLAIAEIEAAASAAQHAETEARRVHFRRAADDLGRALVARLGYRRSGKAPLPPRLTELRWAEAALAEIARLETQVEAAEATLAQAFQNQSSRWERAARELSRARAALAAAQREFYHV